MLGACGDHCGFGDFDASIVCYLLTELLFVCVDRKSSAWIDAFVEFSEVIIDFDLLDFYKSIHHVVVETADVDIIEPLVWFI